MAQIINRGNNRWLVRVFLGRDASGKRMHRNHTIKGTKKDAQEWARKTETDVSAGTYREPTRETVAEYLTAWLDGAAKLSVRPQTLASYRKTLLRYVVPAVGQKRLAQLALADVDRLYASMVGQGFSPRTVRYTHAVLRCALRKAVKARKLAFNPTDDATLPRAVAQERRNVGRDVAAKLLEAAAGDRWHALWVLLVTCGLRPGEALGLKWEDLDGSTLRVQRVVIKERGGWRFNEPKTEKSRRAVALPATTIAALKLHRRRQAEERLRAGEAFTDHGFIFANEAGGPLDMRNLAKRHLAPLLVAAKLPKLRLYDLRHMMATVALEGGMHPKVVSERLGHSTIKLTMDTYSHVSDALQQEAAQQIEGLLFTTSKTA